MARIHVALVWYIWTLVLLCSIWSCNEWKDYRHIFAWHSHALLSVCLDPGWRHLGKPFHSSNVHPFGVLCCCVTWLDWEHLFVCPGGIYRYVPVTSYYAGGRVPSRVLVCLPRIFPRTMSLSALIGGARCPLAEEIEACIRQDRQAKMHSEPGRDHFLLITRCCFTLCKEWISPNSYLCIYNKNCRQANGDNRQIVPDVPTGLDQDIRYKPIACARTHPDANKHTRHIPMHQPVHSVHANKCSHCGRV